MSFHRALVVLCLAAGSCAQTATPPAESPVWFVDIAAKAGLGAARNTFGGDKEKKYIIETTGSGVAIIDYDNDGLPDIFFPNGSTVAPAKGKPEPTNQLFRNNGDLTFTDVTDKTGLRASGWGQGACVGDFDNDGRSDLYVTYYGRNRLYRNLGGKFADVTDTARAFGEGRYWSTGCAFVDYDRDGLLDIAVATYVDFDIATAPAPGEAANCQWKGAPVMCGPRGLKWRTNLLFHNLGNGRFADVTKASGFDKTNGHYCFSVSTLDFDLDGWTDIYIACDSTPSILFRNNHDGTFTDVAVLAGAAYNEDGREQAGMGSAIADYDGDGHLDIYKTNFSDDTSTLYRNLGDAAFDDVTYRAGLGVNTEYLGWGIGFADFDNDTWPDVVQVNGHVYPEVDAHKLGSEYREPRLYYRNLGNGKFQDLSRVAGPAIAARTSGRGIASADFNNDGALEVVVTNMGEIPSLLANERKSGNHWLELKLVGTKSNRDAIGARVTLNLPCRGDACVARPLSQEVRSGSSYNSSNDLRLHFGLGAADRIESIEVRWPNGLKETFDAENVDVLQTLVEGSSKKPQAKP